MRLRIEAEDTNRTYLANEGQMSQINCWVCNWSTAHVHEMWSSFWKFRLFPMTPCSCEENTRPSTGSSRNSDPLAWACSALVTSTMDVSSRDGKTHTTRTKANPKSQTRHVSRLVLSPLQFPPSFPNPVTGTASAEHWEPGCLSQNSLALCTITPSLIFVIALIWSRSELCNYWT